MLSAFNIFMIEELKKEGITDYRYAGSIHDECVFMCLDSETETVAKCMIRAHCAVWTLLSNRLGIPDVPVNRTIFDIEVDVSKRLRKCSFQKIDTPDIKYDKMGYKYSVNQTTGKLQKITK